MKIGSVILSILVSTPAVMVVFPGCSGSGDTDANDGAGTGGAGGAVASENDDSDDMSGLGGGAGASGASCIPSASEDQPDAEFLDTNCDGIDGDAKRAIFVSPLGDDAGEGTMDSPVATLTEAVVRATAESKDVYVCSATYDENLVINESVRIYGGFACEDGWKRTKTLVEVAPSAGIPISIVDLGGEADGASVAIHNLVFRAADAALAGESSVAGRIVRSSQVSLSRVEFIAGAGSDAGDAQPAPTFSTAASAGQNGASAPSGSSMFGASCYTQDTSNCAGGGICVPNTTWKSSCKNIADNQPKAWRCTGTCTSACETDDGAELTVSRSYGGHGSTPYSAPKIPSTSGVKNSDPAGAGTDGADGAAVSSGFGSVDEAGEYVTSNTGALGKFGKVGKNGRGGDGAPYSYSIGDLQFDQVGGAGGSSGMPGCGGRPGRGGLAGGASIGLIVVDSIVTLERVTISTASGGAGGMATVGASGQTGGAGGKGGASRYLVSSGTSGTQSGNTTWGGKNGAKGGNGGRGGDGGAGGGGPSIGIVVVGTEPDLTAMTFDIGLGGDGGQPIEGSGAAQGASGISDDIYVVE